MCCIQRAIWGQCWARIPLHMTGDAPGQSAPCLHSALALVSQPPSSTWPLPSGFEKHLCPFSSAHWTALPGGCVDAAGTPGLPVCGQICKNSPGRLKLKCLIIISHSSAEQITAFEFTLRPLQSVGDLPYAPYCQLMAYLMPSAVSWWLTLCPLLPVDGLLYALYSQLMTYPMPSTATWWPTLCPLQSVDDLPYVPYRQLIAYPTPSTVSWWFTLCLLPPVDSLPYALYSQLMTYPTPSTVNWGFLSTIPVTEFFCLASW